MPEVNSDSIFDVERLNRHGWTVDYCNSANVFSIVHNEGSMIRNSYRTYAALIAELKELDAENEPAKPISDEEILHLNGYHIICKSPFEIGSESDHTVLITGWAANTLVSTLKFEHSRS